MNKQVQSNRVLKNFSVFMRLTQSFFAERLKPDAPCVGQHYLLARTAFRPGVSMAELAEQGAFDNGSVTRAVQKLESAGLMRVEQNDRDRRAKRLFLTGKGEQLAGELKQLRLDWFSAVTEDMSEEEKAQIDALLERLVNKARVVLESEQRKPEES